jgi:hypothetical protein
MVVDERRPHRIGVGALDARTSGSDAGNSPVKCHGGGRNVAKSRTNRSHPRRRRNYRPTKSGRSGLRVLRNHAAADQTVAERLGIVRRAPAHIRQSLSVPTDAGIAPTISRRRRALGIRSDAPHWNHVPQIGPGFDRHEFRCPHCEKQTLYLWPGSTILFTTATCQHCSQEFLIVQNEPRK